MSPEPTTPPDEPPRARTPAQAAAWAKVEEERRLTSRPAQVQVAAPEAAPSVVAELTAAGASPAEAQAIAAEDAAAALAAAVPSCVEARYENPLGGVLTPSHPGTVSAVTDNGDPLIRWVDKTGEFVGQVSMPKDLVVEIDAVESARRTERLRASKWPGLDGRGR